MNMIEFTAAVLAFCIMIGFIWFLSWIGAHRFMFEYRNNRRFCKRCGQQQDNFIWSWQNFGECGWWEDMGYIFDPKCKCHKYSK